MSEETAYTLLFCCLAAVAILILDSYDDV